MSRCMSLWTKVEGRVLTLASLGHVVGDVHVSQCDQQDISSSGKDGETGEDDHKHIGNLA